MAQNNYFKDIISLYEASKKLETAQVINEEEIDPAQTVNQYNNGEDIVNNDAEGTVYNQIQPYNQGQVNTTATAQNAETMYPQDQYQYPEGLEDTSYLDAQEERTNDIDPEEQENKKLLRLFDLFRNLLVYGKEFKNSLEFIDRGLLEIEELRIINKIKEKLDRQSEKIETYLELSFSNEKYEKALYLYIMLRTELLTMIKELRRILHLNDENNK